MTLLLLTSALVIFACVIFNRISGKLGIPMLLAFILLGMFFGSDGVVKIPFSDYSAAENICSAALIFIMFYGGFGTKWSETKPVAVRAVLLSSVGTVLTAGLVGVFCFFIMKMPLKESFLLGAVISSTDAASVFSILRSKKLNLKYNTASLMEVESGSNDPFAYMLTVVILSLMNGGVTVSGIIYTLFAQIVYGAVFGVIIALLSVLFLDRFDFTSSGFDAIFIVAVALASYAIPAYCGGNGYLSAYITGIIIGNHTIRNKQALVHFFDGATGLMQMLLFFLLGLLSTPSLLPGVAVTGLCVALFLTFVARPAAVFAVLAPFKSSVRQQLLVSWAGMRGAASIVFAIMAVIDPANVHYDIFHTVFFIVLFSILFQGSLIPFAARKLDMTDDSIDVMKTFNDYIDEVPVQFIQFSIGFEHPWNNMPVSSIVLPPESIFVLLIRGKERIVPNGSTVLQTGDTLILSGKTAEKVVGVDLYEKVVGKNSSWVNKTISSVTTGDDLIIMIRRGESVIIPGGNTVMRENDTLVINRSGTKKSKPKR